MARFKVGDEVRIPGFEVPRRVIEVWRGRKIRYLVGQQIIELATQEPIEGMYKVDMVVDENKLEAAP